MTDPSRTYTQEEDEKLARNLYFLLDQVHRRSLSERRLDIRLLCDFHNQLFAGVRSFAGKHRSRGYGSERLVFGPNRSVDRTEVPSQLEKIFAEARRSLASFDSNPNDRAYEPLGLHLAVWSHAEIIRVHPFEDGNGRSARALMNWILVRLGLRQIAIEVPRQEYHDCLNYYYARGDIQPLVDLALGLYRLP